MEFYAWCKERGMYVHAPDPYYFRGINKDGMGYVETNWNLPLWEQITLARQNIYDGTWVKAPSQGWMFVPLVPSPRCMLRRSRQRDPVLWSVCPCVRRADGL